jgi:D-sedoheptulose 7-phosphate isomerase
MDRRGAVLDRIEKSISAKRSLERCVDEIILAADEIVKHIDAGGEILLFGNGGSAADAQHIAAEFVGSYRINRDPLPAIALNTNVSVLTAVANDSGFENIFSRQIEALACSVDVVIGISTSWRSKNVLEGMRSARKQGAFLIAFAGECAVPKELADIIIPVMSSETSIIQESHILIGHIICQLVEEEMFGEK